MRRRRILAGCSPDERGDDALVLAALVARGTGAAVTAANVHPPPWPARGPGAVDAEWLAYLRSRAEEVVAASARRLAELGVPAADVEPRVHAHRGSGRGLIEVAAETGADLVVIGSAPRGRRGRIAVGSTADQLLHGSPVPVLLAPRGYGAAAPARLDRLTAAYWRRRDAGGGPVDAAAGWAAALDVPMRLLTLVLRPPAVAARFRDSGEVLERQRERAEEDLARAAARVAGVRAGTEMSTEVSIEVSTEAVTGASVGKALAAVDMLPGEVLACQSGHHGPLRKVFLGESSGKIVRSAPRPVLVLPRGASRSGTGTNAQLR
ncbi:universal stress protein [Actinomadura sp. WMMB 499]|uniref:universal stress protein n=1 Tax=Actinomadura sp. WMMB 499 TaxID=1219491 RepID=UPI001247D7F8|nr:universal stress protein [Actinomadura sp. WMMB 499]QFG19974.1 universal stress protein [Actinomadura sp. WMMB 499]